MEALRVTAQVGADMGPGIGSTIRPTTQPTQTSRSSSRAEAKEAGIVVDEQSDAQLSIVNSQRHRFFGCTPCIDGLKYVFGGLTIYAAMMAYPLLGIMALHDGNLLLGGVTISICVAAGFLALAAMSYSLEEGKFNVFSKEPHLRWAIGGEVTALLVGGGIFGTMAGYTHGAMQSGFIAASVLSFVAIFGYGLYRAAMAYGNKIEKEAGEAAPGLVASQEDLMAGSFAPDFAGTV